MFNELSIYNKVNVPHNASQELVAGLERQGKVVIRSSQIPLPKDNWMGFKGDSSVRKNVYEHVRDASLGDLNRMRGQTFKAGE